MKREKREGGGERGEGGNGGRRRGRAGGPRDGCAIFCFAFGLVFHVFG